MKVFLLAMGMFALNAISFSQTCPTITSSYITKLSSQNYRLTINYSGSGLKHMNVALFNGSTTIDNFISSICEPAPGSGTANIDFSTTSTTPSALVVPGTGSCGGTDLCASFLVLYTPATEALPILISSFTAKRVEQKVLVNWQTSNEVNSREFVVERNTGNGFMPVKSIAATNQSAGDDYSYTDINPVKGTTLYRLRMIDFDGTFAYSETRTVKGMEDRSSLVAVYPNPAVSNSTVTIPLITEPSDVIIYDNVGKSIKKTIITQGNVLSLNGIKPGMYILRIITRSTGVTVSEKLNIN